MAKGKKVLDYKLAGGKPTEGTVADVIAQIMGRSGNLRAPAIGKGKTLYVGFNEGFLEYGL